MNRFAYFNPQDIDKVFALLDKYGEQARILAGGTDLLVRLKAEQINPSAVIDIKNVSELNGGVVNKNSVVRIGALTLISTVASDGIICGLYPALAEAAIEIGSVQIRNRATLAGNLCNASPAADSAPSLLIYGAQVEIVSSKTTRVVDLKDFILGPGKTGLAKGELVKAVLVPVPQEDQRASFVRLTRRRGVDLATINVSCQVFKTGLTRFAIGAAAPAPFIIEDTSGKLVDPQVEEDQKKKIVQRLMEKAAPITDVRASKEYRQDMLVVLGMRALVSTLKKFN